MTGEGMANFWGDMPEEEFYTSQGVKHSEEYFDSPGGKLFTQSWLPLSQDPKGVICCTHGYGGDAGWAFQIVTIAAAQWGFAAYAADLPGHGRSPGLPGYIESFDETATHLLCFYKSVRDRDENKGLPAFLLGESMSGAITLLMHLQDPKGWNGVVLSAPLLRVGAAMVIPSSYMTSFKLLGSLIGTWQIVPRPACAPRLYRNPSKAKICAANPRRYLAKPRVKTRLEISRITEYLGQNYQKIEAPLLILHGTADNITDPEGSREFFEKAASTDKTIKLYDGAYHSLIQGELEEIWNCICADMKDWLDSRSGTSRHAPDDPIPR